MATHTHQAAAEFDPSKPLMSITVGRGDAGHYTVHTEYNGIHPHAAAACLAEMIRSLMASIGESDAAEIGASLALLHWINTPAELRPPIHRPECPGCGQVHD